METEMKTLNKNRYGNRNEKRSTKMVMVMKTVIKKRSMNVVMETEMKNVKRKWLWKQK